MPRKTPLQQLDAAKKIVRDLGLSVDAPAEVPIGGLLKKIYDLDKDKVTIIAKTLSEVAVFNEIVRNEVSGMEIGQRYNEIISAFNSIRDDAKRLVDQLDDGKINTFERVSNIWM